MALRLPGEAESLGSICTEVVMNALNMLSRPEKAIVGLSSRLTAMGQIGNCRSQTMELASPTVYLLNPKPGLERGW